MQSQFVSAALVDPPPLTLVQLVETLSVHRDLPRLPADPFQLVLWENMGALIDDARRAASFAEFGQKVGFEPGRILTADGDLLLSIARKGGMRPEVRVERAGVAERNAAFAERLAVRAQA